MLKFRTSFSSTPHFVTWKFVEIDGKLKKPPFSPQTGHLAKPTDASTWGSFQQALTAFQSGRFNGIGFVFSPDDPFAGTDLDHCIQPDGTPEAWVLPIVVTLNSYTEYSPSGTGLHILTRATLPKAGGRHKENTELYDTGRYFTITANHLEGTPRTILARQQAIEILYESLAVAQPQATEMHQRVEYALAQTRRDDEVLKKAMGAKNGASLTDLFNGNSAGFRSKSEADFTLVLRLLYWTNDDVEQTKRLFRQSGLYDPEKTESPREESTYLDVTIANALKKRRT